MYKAKVIKWGNSQAISLQKALLEDLNLDVGDMLDVFLNDRHEILIRKSDGNKEIVNKTEEIF